MMMLPPVVPCQALEAVAVVEVEAVIDEPISALGDGRADWILASDREDEVGGNGPALDAGNEVDPATAWWRFYPDVLEKRTAPSERADGHIEGGDEDPGAAASAGNDEDFLAAAVHAQVALRNSGNDVAKVINRLKAPNALPGTSPLPSNSNVDRAIANYRMPAPDNKLLFVYSTEITTCRRFPLPLDRPVIGQDCRYVYRRGYRETGYRVTETVTYQLPSTHPRVVARDWEQVTVEDFAEVELRDPYWRCVVRPNPRGHDETVVYGVVVPDTISRRLRKRLEWFLGAAVPLRDGDLDWLAKWKRKHAKYYTLALRTVPDDGYDPYSETLQMEDSAFPLPFNGKVVPLLGHFMTMSAQLISDVRRAELPALYVPDTLEAGHAELDVPPGFQHTLRPYQKRSLSWLVTLERDARARTMWVRKLPPNAPKFDEKQFDIFEAHDVPVAVQLGPDGPWFNLFTRQWARANHWITERAPLVPVECRSALEVSRVGAGKTVTALALVHANPFRSVRDIPWAEPGDCDRYLVSRATLVVVRSDLAAQWYVEAKRALPASAKIFQLTAIHDYRKISWNDLLLADVVIVSTAAQGPPAFEENYLPDTHSYGIKDPGEAAALDSPFVEWGAAVPRDSDTAFAAQLDQHVFALRQQGRTAFGPTTNAVILERVHLHRIVIDECHELGIVTASHSMASLTLYRRSMRDTHSKTEKTEELLNSLRASFWLGLTGTPPINKPESVVALAETVQVRGLPISCGAALAFLNTCVRRNNPTLTVPLVHYRTEWVTMTAAEMGLMASQDTNGALPKLARLMMCNHHQITDALGEHTVDQVAALLQTAREVKMLELANRARNTQKELAAAIGLTHALVVKYPGVVAALVGTGVSVVQPGHVIHVDGHAALDALAVEAHVPVGPGKPDPVPTSPMPVSVPSVVSIRTDMPRDDVIRAARRVVDARRAYLDLMRQLRQIAGEWNFMNAVLDAIRRAEEQTCPLCLEPIAAGQPLAMTRCGHVYCVRCATNLVRRAPKQCAICRGALEGAYAVTRMVLTPPNPNRPPAAAAPAQVPPAVNGAVVDGIDYAKYGSKIRALVAYVRRVLAADPTAKLILFSQFRRLTTLISRALSEFQIPNVSLAGGNVFTKRRAVTLFRTDPDMKILFLSSDDCVSGLHLTEANHVVIVHPFLGASETMSRAYEMQGIARAVRAGQTREVTVVRFVTHNTIEEDMMARRADVQLAPTATADGQDHDGDVVMRDAVVPHQPAAGDATRDQGLALDWLKLNFDSDDD
ncbi:hypothetical protein GGF32_001848 [Allomyces javanicus]|nr:hypothetical protein GGF32_001848 [Allomyces javanicus]